ncbi:MAG TPA: hypothetical protein VKT32_08600, partial [Chthonomonadaceae bacterium]|nr:hypothetical protein [Chthonomonadaceae bacterium]
VVAGAAALMLQANPALSPDTLKARLMISADKWCDASGNYDPCTYGAGYLNIPAALANTTQVNAYAVSPALSRDGSGNVVVNNILWGTSGPTSSNIIWGVSTINLNTIWGANVLWGSNILWGNNILWGAGTWNDTRTWASGTSGVDLSATALNGE